MPSSTGGKYAVIWWSDAGEEQTCTVVAIDPVDAWRIALSPPLSVAKVLQHRQVNSRVVKLSSPDAELYDAIIVKLD